MALPEILDLNFKIDEQKLWKINLPIEEIAISDIEYNMDIPYLEKEGTDDWNLTPRMLIENFDKEFFHAKKTIDADLVYPIEIYFNQEKRIILDGVHRFTKAVRSGNKTIKIRRISEEIAQKTKRKGKKWEKWLKENI